MQRFNSSRWFARRLHFESLEDRRVLATFAVTSLNDAPVAFPGAAPGTLRQAIYDANHTAGADVIQFDAGLSGTINLSTVDDTSIGFSALVVSSPITIQGNIAGITIARSATAAEMRLFHITSTGDLTLNTISITGGVARGIDGATQAASGGEGRGGAIYNEGALHVVTSTLYANKGIGGNGGMFGGAGSGRGGAIYSDGGSVTISNATLSGDIVQSGTGSKGTSSFGGGIFIRNGALSIYNSTLTNNTATTGRGVYILAQNGAATADIWSSIIGQNNAPLNARDFLPGIDTGGQLTVTGGNNLIRVQGDYQFITVSTDDPLLGPLANNGGPTMTHALLAGSPAINLGSNPQNLSFDQRGGSHARVIGGTADIGAFEMQTAAAPSLPGDYTGSHRVDAADYVLWRNTLGTNVGAFSGADGNGDGSVNTADYEVWRANYGSTGAAGSQLSLPQSVDATPSESSHVQFAPVGSSLSSNKSSRSLVDKSATHSSTVELSLLNALSPILAATRRTYESSFTSDGSDSSNTIAEKCELDDAIWDAWSPAK